VALGDLCGGGQFFKEYLTTEYTEGTEKGTRCLKFLVFPLWPWVISVVEDSFLKNILPQSTQSAQRKALGA
jgi:hypothetical protein